MPAAVIGILWHLFIGATKEDSFLCCMYVGRLRILVPYTTEPLFHCRIGTVLKEILLPSHTILNHCSTGALELVNEIFRDVTQNTKEDRILELLYQGNHVVVLLVSR